MINVEINLTGVNKSAILNAIEQAKKLLEEDYITGSDHNEEGSFTLSVQGENSKFALCDGDGYYTRYFDSREDALSAIKRIGRTGNPVPALMMFIEDEERWEAV